MTPEPWITGGLMPCQCEVVPEWIVVLGWIALFVFCAVGPYVLYRVPIWLYHMAMWYKKKRKEV